MTKLLDKNIRYVNTNVTRFQTELTDENEKEEILRKYRELWNKRNIVFIEGNKTRLGVGNDLFDNAASIKRIIAPNVNAFAKHNEILDYCKKNISKEDLIILALGPTATVLAYDLCNEGFWALDLGHLDIQYEYYLRGITDRSYAIPGKYVNEAGVNNKVNSLDITDKSYFESVVAEFT